METKVTLLSWTQNPIQTIYAIWYASREERAPIVNLSKINPNDPKVIEVFQKIINAHLPVADALNFVFLLENVSIALREQMVRHRVGVRLGDRLGVDMIPELGQSSWWGQGMRILDMGRFAKESRYYTPETVSSGDLETKNIYTSAMTLAEEMYCRLVSKGIPREDARNVIPLAASHNITWIINLSALKHIIGKRGCWIPQLGLWKPVIKGMVDELSVKIHPSFRGLINPPCIENNKFKECLFKLDNENRIKGIEEPVPCPLYLHHHDKRVFEPTHMTPNRYKTYLKQFDEFQALWGRDPYTGDELVIDAEDENIDALEGGVDNQWNT